MTTATKATQTPAKAAGPSPASPAAASEPKKAVTVDFNALQVVEGGEIVRKRSAERPDPLVGTPILAQLQKSYDARDKTTGHGPTFTVGPVPKEAEQVVKSAYNLGASRLGIGVSFGYDGAKQALTVRAQNRKKADPEMRAATSAARKAGKAAGATDEQIEAAVKAARAKVVASRTTVSQ